MEWYQKFNPSRNAHSPASSQVGSPTALDPAQVKRLDPIVCGNHTVWRGLNSTFFFERPGAPAVGPVNLTLNDQCRFDTDTTRHRRWAMWSSATPREREAPLGILGESLEGFLIFAPDPQDPHVRSTYMKALGDIFLRWSKDNNLSKEKALIRFFNHSEWSPSPLNDNQFTVVGSHGVPITVSHKALTQGLPVASRIVEMRMGPMAPDEWVAAKTVLESLLDLRKEVPLEVLGSLIAQSAQHDFETMEGKTYQRVVSTRQLWGGASIHIHIPESVASPKSPSWISHLPHLWESVFKPFLSHEFPRPQSWEHLVDQDTLYTFLKSRGQGAPLSWEDGLGLLEEAQSFEQGDRGRLPKCKSPQLCTVNPMGLIQRGTLEVRGYAAHFGGDTGGWLLNMVTSAYAIVGVLKEKAMETVDGGKRG